MSDIFEETNKYQQKAPAASRVAYTLNNSQPVLCSIIGDQPLFYLDHSYDANADDVEMSTFDDADFAILENELCALKDEISALDRFSESFSDTTESRVFEFLDNKDSMFGVDPTISQDDDINDLIDILQKSRLAKAYLECAEKYNVTLDYNSQIETAIYDRKNAKIFINPNLKHVDQILLAAQELRRHYQHRQGVLIHPLMFQPENAILVNRAQICDLMVSVIRIAWELQLSGMREAWERIENSSMADLGRSFAREAYLDFRTINNGEAATAVFETWFLSERCRAQDKILIQHMLSDYQGYVFEMQQITQSITPTLIAGLGEMPFGKNYLAEHALTIINDPIFSEIRDRSNANFLWFIKFERSFRETEHDLQPKDHLNADAPSGSFQTQDKDGIYGFAAKEDFSAFEQQSSTARSADIITLYSDDEKSARKPKRLSRVERNIKRNQQADIIDIRQWSKR